MTVAPGAADGPTPERRFPPASRRAFPNFRPHPRPAGPPRHEYRPRPHHPPSISAVLTGPSGIGPTTTVAFHGTAGVSRETPGSRPGSGNRAAGGGPDPPGATGPGVPPVEPENGPPPPPAALHTASPSLTLTSTRPRAASSIHRSSGYWYGPPDPVVPDPAAPPDPGACPASPPTSFHVKRRPAPLPSRDVGRGLGFWPGGEHEAPPAAARRRVGPEMRPDRGPERRRADPQRRLPSRPSGADRSEGFRAERASREERGRRRPERGAGSGRHPTASMFHVKHRHGQGDDLGRAVPARPRGETPAGPGRRRNGTEETPSETAGARAFHVKRTGIALVRAPRADTSAGLGGSAAREGRRPGRRPLATSSPRRCGPTCFRRLPGGGPSRRGCGHLPGGDVG